VTQLERARLQLDSFALQCDSAGGVVLRNTSCKHQVQSMYIESRIDTSTAVETHDSHRCASMRGSPWTDWLLFRWICSRDTGL